MRREVVRVRTLRMSVLAILALGLGHAVALANWEEAWRVGDTWTYQVTYVENPQPFTGPTFHHQYGLTMTVVGGSFDAPYDLGVTMWTWVVQVESERYGFSEIWEERVYLVEGARVLRWPLPTLFLWYDVSYQPEEGAARVGILGDGAGPAVWEWRIPIESAGVPRGEVVHRIVIEPVDTAVVEVAGSPVEATQFQYRAETRTDLAGSRPRLRVHSGTAWGSSATKNWVAIEGRDEEDGRVVREYQLDLVSFSLSIEGPSHP